MMLSAWWASWAWCSRCSTAPCSSSCRAATASCSANSASSKDDRLTRLKRFFSPQVAEMIDAGGMDDPLQTHRREITAVSIDLRGFTAFTESAEPEEVIGLLREVSRGHGQDHPRAPGHDRVLRGRWADGDLQ
jgi:hypothetical protein